MQFISTLKGASEAVQPQPTPDPGFNLVMSSSYVELSSAETLLDDGTSSYNVDQIFVPRMLFNPVDGKTHFIYMRYQVDRPHGQLMMLTFDKNRGWDVAITVGSVMIPEPVTGNGDTHTVPSMIIAEDPEDGIRKVYCVQERTHMTPLDFYKDVYGDQSYFTFPGQIGLNLAYPHLIEKDNGDVLIWSRGGNLSGNSNHLYTIFVTESDNKFEGLDSATPRQIMQKTAQGLWHYPGVPFGYQKVNGWYHYIAFRRTGLADGGTIGGPITNEASHRFYKFKTQDHITFWNHTGTYSHDTSEGLLTDAIASANYQYHQTNANNIQGRQAVSGMSSEEFFVGIQGAANGDGSYVFIYYDESGTVVKKPISITNLMSQDADDPNPIFNTIMVFGQDDVRCVVYRTVGGFSKPWLARTTNLGDSWTVTDMCPEVTDKNLRVLVPNNIMQIPKNTNFPIYFGYLDTAGTRRNLICKVAAWNNIQPIPGVTITPATDLNYNSKGLVDYEFTDAKITRSGTNILTLVDNFGNINAVSANSPQWISPDACSLVAGSSQYFSIPTPTDIVNKNSFTFFIVVKLQSVTGPILCMSLTSATNRYFEITAVNDGHLQIRVTDNFTAVVTNQDLLTDGQFHVVSGNTDGRARADLYIDGKRQYFETNLLPAAAITTWEFIGKGAAKVGATVVNIGRRQINTTNVYSTIELKRLALLADVMPYAEFHSRNKMLCDMYGITYQNQFKIPS